MEKIGRIVSELCGMELVISMLCMLIPEGGVKRFAEYAFAMIRSAYLMKLLIQILQMLNGVFT